MPEWVGKCNYESEKFNDEDQYSCYLRTGTYKSWMKYWGTTGPIMIDIDQFYSVKKFKTTSRIDGEFEIIESETGAVQSKF